MMEWQQLKRQPCLSLEVTFWLAQAVGMQNDASTTYEGMLELQRPPTTHSVIQAMLGFQPWPTGSTHADVTSG